MENGPFHGRGGFSEVGGQDPLERLRCGICLHALLLPETSVEGTGGLLRLAAQLRHIADTPAVHVDRSVVGQDDLIGVEDRESYREGLPVQGVEIHPTIGVLTAGRR